MYTIRVDQILEQGLALDESLPVEFLNETLPEIQELKPQGPALAKLLFSREGGRIRVIGKVSASFSATCALCAKPFAFETVAPVDMVLFQKISTAASDDHSSDDNVAEVDQDVGSWQFDGQNIAWGELAREQLLLAIPIAPRCKEDCLGLCPECGVDRNLEVCNCATSQVDPRWNKLRLLSGQV